MPCESQPRWYCLERVMRYRLNRQLIQGQIASVIQNKHGWHTTHRLDSTLPRNCQTHRENRPDIHFCSVHKGDPESGFYWCDFFFFLYLKSDTLGKYLQFAGVTWVFQSTFFFLMFTAPLLSCFNIYFIGELREDKCFTTAATALDMEMSWYWF